LNRLTATNINTISDEIKKITITKREHMEKLIDSIFSKAIKETRFTAIYATFVSQMLLYKITVDSKDVIFADLFIKKCKCMFDECLAFETELEKQYLDEVDTKVSKTFNFKDEVIGCINFVGELYNNRILKDNIICICLKSIMKAHESNKVYCIDILCNLIKTIARKFSVSNISVICENSNNLLKIRDNVSLKERFIIMDLIDFLNKEGYTQIKY